MATRKVIMLPMVGELDIACHNKSTSSIIRHKLSVLMVSSWRRRLDLRLRLAPLRVLRQRDGQLIHHVCHKVVLAARR